MSYVQGLVTGILISVVFMGLFVVYMQYIDRKVTPIILQCPETDQVLIPDASKLEL